MSTHNFIENFRQKNNRNPLRAINCNINYQSYYPFIVVYLFFSTYYFLRKIDFSNKKIPKKRMPFLFFITFYMPLCLGFCFIDYKDKQKYNLFHNKLMKTENAGKLIEFYRYHNNKINPNSKYFINKTNIILCRYFNNNFY